MTLRRRHSRRWWCLLGPDKKWKPSSAARKSTILLLQLSPHHSQNAKSLITLLQRTNIKKEIRERERLRTWGKELRKRVRLIEGEFCREAIAGAKPCLVPQLVTQWVWTRDPLFSHLIFLIFFFWCNLLICSTPLTLVYRFVSWISTGTHR